jgi:DNA mismatch repair protein MSH3
VRSELETRLTHLQPAELILPKVKLSKTTEKVLKHITASPGETVRVERVDVPEYTDAFDFLTEFYKSKDKEKEKKPIDLTEEDEEGDGDVSMHEDGEGERDEDPIGLARGLPRELVAKC